MTSDDLQNTPDDQEPIPELDRFFFQEAEARMVAYASGHSGVLVGAEGDVRSDRRGVDGLVPVRHVGEDGRIVADAGVVSGAGVEIGGGGGDLR
ncbi:hypothetical protein [Candidatus Magnetaquiglobus chichijimensis]|uniref:hypothetical protein n=1 Tax=Candidatus Magnetaquiglobus chichijimensis TaxID=3141448 RepID=UPI003B978FCA